MEVNNMKWWEKTVEYMFVIEAERQFGLLFAAPMAGVEENAFGDGVFSIDASLILVEFKRSINEIDSDKTKFTDYEAAERQLVKRDSHHYLVYGSYDEAANGELSLQACTYFSRQDVADADGVSILSKGVDVGVFNTYLKDLISWKDGDGRSSGEVSPEAVSCIVGITPKGASSISLSEYVRQELPSLYHAYNQSSSMKPM